jgi:prepilin-type N-terminal cleavage/methylation domain-containing protein
MSARAILRRHDHPAQRRGFSLLELMMVVTIIGILVAMAAPSYLQAVRQSRADIAAANLRAIWAAERLYWLEYHTYTEKLNANSSATIGVVSLVELGLLDAELFTSGPNKYTYTFEGSDPVNGIITTFGAKATNEIDGIIITMDDAGVVTSPDITLGFQ